MAISSYGTARTYAEVLGERTVARLLAQTLREEKSADGRLTTIAERSVNEDAVEEWRAQEDEGLLDRSSAWVGGAVQAASRRLKGSARKAAINRRPRPRRSGGRKGGTKANTRRMSPRFGPGEDGE